MLEKGEVEFELDERNCTTTVVVEPLLKHMRLTKFPFVVGSEQAVISPPLEKVLELLDSGATIGARLTIDSRLRSDPMDSQLCLLTVHAHPDDEASKGAATVARYHAEGVRTILVCCTGGEEGDILNPAMDRPDVRENIHDVRMQELAASAAIIGFDEVVMLGYRDSGMPDTAANRHPDNFANADLDEAVGQLVRIIRRERPQVMITYPPVQGRYLHPDHLRVHEVSVPAFELAGDPGYRVEVGDPWGPTKLYYTVRTRSRMEGRHAAFLEQGLDSPYDKTRLERPTQDDRITTQISTDGHAAVRLDALRAHATQIDPNSKRYFGLPAEVEHSIHPFDDYVLALGPEPAQRPEIDLFAGIR
jgi:mycothiol S-conjugate amidase